MRQHHFPQDKRCHLTVRFIVDDAIQRVVLCFNGALIRLFIHGKRQAGNGLRDDPHTCVHDRHLDRVSRCDRLTRAAAAEGKGRRGADYIPRLVPRSEQSGEWIFHSRKGGHITRQWVFQILKKLAADANIPQSSLSPHVLRHAFATHILDNGGNLISIKKMLGHKSISTTEIYTHVSKAKLKEVINTKHPLNKIIHDS